MERFPGGSSYTYERTVQLDADTAAAVQNGTAVVVVHGVDPAGLTPAAQEKMSELDPALPLAATLPAACGTLAPAQMGAMPEGGADTGVEQTGSTAEVVALGSAVLAAAAGGAWAMRRRAARA